MKLKKRSDDRPSIGVTIPKHGEKLAEFIGIMLGDGHLHKTQNLLTVTGSLEDLHYYQIRVIPLIQDLFSLTPKLRARKDRNSYYLFFHSKIAMDLLTGLGMMRGNKSKATIPNFVLNKEINIRSFLRGLFDTDGCIKFSKQSKKMHYYPRIQFSIKESPVVRELRPLIEKLGFNVGSWTECRQVTPQVYYQLSGFKATNDWFQRVSPTNPVHVSKFLYWDKFGNYVPMSSLAQRLSALDLKIEDLY